MLHREVHGALEALDAGVDHLHGNPRGRLLDVQIEGGGARNFTSTSLLSGAGTVWSIGSAVRERGNKREEPGE